MQKPSEKLLIDQDRVKYASDSTTKKSHGLDEEIDSHNEAFRRYSELCDAVCAGEIDFKKPYDQKQRLVRQKFDLLAARVLLIERRIALRALLRQEFLPYRNARHAELVEAQAKAKVKAEECWPPSDSPDRYDKRAELIEQLTKNEAKAARWEPQVLSGSWLIKDAADLKAARSALAALFRE